MSQPALHWKVLHSAVLIVVLGTACSDEKRRAEKPDRASTFHPPTTMNPIPRTAPTSGLDDATLALLPPLMNAGGEVNSALLRGLGIPSDEAAHLIQALQNSREEAQQLLDQATRSLRYPLDIPVQIPPLSKREIKAILERFQSEIFSLEATAASVSELGILLERQLEREFGTPLSVTLKRTENLTLSHYAHTPREYFGMVFEVTRQKVEGGIETFTVDPVQPKSSQFFYLNLKR